MKPALIVVELVPLEALRLDPRNARKHGARNLENIKASLSEYGQRKNIVIDADGVILAGNGTYRAAEALGWTHINAERVPLRGAKARAFAIADNRAAELAEWDALELSSQLEELRNLEGFDLAAVGFSSEEIDAQLEAITAAIAGPLSPEDPAPSPSAPVLPFQLLVSLATLDQLEEAAANIRDLGYAVQSVEAKATRKAPRKPRARP